MDEDMPMLGSAAPMMYSEEPMPIAYASEMGEPTYMTMGAPDMGEPMYTTMGAPDMGYPKAYATMAPTDQMMQMRGGPSPQPNYRGAAPNAGFNQNAMMQMHNHLLRNHPGYAQQFQQMLQMQRPQMPMQQYRPQINNAMQQMQQMQQYRPQMPNMQQYRPQMPMPQRPQMPMPNMQRPQPNMQAMSAINNALRLAQNRRG